ncbi:MAG: hypothetical protein ACQGVC_10055 [Myxococcota bacterium]
MKGGVLRACVAVVLGVSALWVAATLHQVGQTRYFTVDEYQFGHASWLVSEGHVPYVDFYEHHWPAQYVLHAPLVAGDAPFPDRALRLRSAAFAWQVLLALALGVATGVVLRDPLAGLLAAQLPLAFGFSALSAVDYRADNFAGVAWLVCLSLLEVGRRRPSAARAATAGALLAVAVLSTQKLALIGGVPVAVWLLRDRLRSDAVPCVTTPAAFLAGGAVVTGGALLAAAGLGMLGPGFEATVRHAFGHEDLYPAVSLGSFVAPFWSETWPSTLVWLGLAAVGLATRAGRFLALPLLVALAVGLSIRGRFPYNYLVPCVLGGVLAARGVAWAAARAPSRWAPLVYLLPLLLLPDQLGFVQGRTSNAHQLHVLAKIERHTGPGDVVVDDAGGALFRDHASHVWYHGPAHRAVMADHFEHQFPLDLRASRAPFWIRDFRFKGLPEPSRRYLLDHYARADGWLYALGFVVPAADEPVRRTIDVVRAGTWFAYPAPGGRVAPQGFAEGVAVDGRPVGAAGVVLGEGPHTLTAPAGGAPLVLTPHARQVFLDRFERMRPYALLFEYERKPGRAWRDRTLLTP